MQVAIYARVSTTRQAENDLSIPDQLRQARAWCERHGHVVVKEYVEPGASATDDKRPVFQEMVNDVTTGTIPLQAIIVHSLSRFFRDLVMGAMYQKKLLKAGVQLISITQQTQNDPSGDMQRHIFMLFDEYQSKETAKHVLRGMQENARQGYFNGSKAPFGYMTVDAGQTGIRGRFKKKLAILESEAVIVREIFEHYVTGVNSPRIGAKEIAKLFNSKGGKMRGKVWDSQKVLRILANPVYAGNHRFNRYNAKTGHSKNTDEWITIAVPAIIGQETYDQAAKLRTAFAPTACAPRRETSPTLLTGLVRCGHCGAAMVMATGKSGQYRYYKCTTRLKRGNAACPSKNLPMDKLDNLVLDAFRQQVYTAEHIRNVLDTLRQQLAKSGSKDGKQQLKQLEARLLETEQAQARLYEAVEKGLMELDDQLKVRVQQHKQTRETILTEIAASKRQHQSPLAVITPMKIEAVAITLNKRLAEASPYAKAYLKASVSEIRVRDGIISPSGSNAALANLVAANGKIDGQNQVPRFREDWWS
jgi:DNA invertase Pin-like site-specific DNA recombinase